MNTRGRPRTITDAAIILAGKAMTLPEVTVAGIAEALGVSEMSIYRRTGGIAALRLLVADGIVASASFELPVTRDPEDTLVGIAEQLRDFVIEHPGIATHLTRLDRSSSRTLEQIEQAQAAFAAQHHLTPAQASILVSTIAEHAVALAAISPRSHSEPRDPKHLSDLSPTIQAGATAAAGALSPAQHFEWSMRATARGALALLGLPTRADTPVFLD